MPGGGGSGGIMDLGGIPGGGGGIPPIPIPIPIPIPMPGGGGCIPPIPIPPCGIPGRGGGGGIPGGPPGPPGPAIVGRWTGGACFEDCSLWLSLMARRYPSVGSLEPSHTMGRPVPDMSFSLMLALTT